jgi:hypothetical protein
MGYAERKRQLELQRQQEWDTLPEIFFPTYWPVKDAVSAVRPHHLEPCFCLLCRVKFWYPKHYWYIYTMLVCPD